MTDNTPKKPLIEIKPPGYKTEQVDNDSDFSTHLIVAGRARRGHQPVELDLKPTDPYITGVYEFASGMNTICINQAGKHIQCWLSEVLTSEQNHRSQKLVRLAGDLQDAGEFVLYENYSPSNRKGYLKVCSEKIEIRINDSGMIGYGSDELVLIKSKITWSENMLEALQAGDQAVLHSQWFPFSRQQIEYINVMLDTDVLGTYISSFLNIATSNEVSTRLKLQAKAIELDNYISFVFSASTLDYQGKKVLGWHKGDLELAQLYGYLQVLLNRATFETVNRSILGWLQHIVDVVEHGRFDRGNQSLTPHIDKNFGLKSHIDEQEHVEPYYYVLVIESGGGSVNLGPILTLGGYVGSIRIEKWRNKDEYERYKDSSERIRKERSQLNEVYPIVVGDMSAGASSKWGVSAGKRVQGFANSYADYSVADFPGAITIVDSGGNLGPANYAETALILTGSERLPKLKFDCSGFIWQPALSCGGGQTMSTGHILKKTGTIQRVPDPYSTLTVKDYTAELSLEAEVFFSLGDSYLVDFAKQFLRVFCATELALFTNSDSQITFVGHADRLDTFRRNFDLSYYRAINTREVIKNILGSYLSILPKNRRHKSLGEHDAVVARDKDNTPNPNFRKVEIILNRVLMVTLRGK